MVIARVQRRQPQLLSGRRDEWPRHGVGQQDTHGDPPSLLVLTIGHSTRPLSSFIHALKAHGVEEVVDVWTIPRSRHHPQFNPRTLALALYIMDIRYRPLPGLGGLRSPVPDSVNGGRLNASFRGFVDYMHTVEFGTHLDTVINLANHVLVALMCTEVLPWWCHRALIADALLMRGIRVEHILTAHHRRVHTLTPWAFVKGMRLSYPEETPYQLDCL